MLKNGQKHMALNPLKHGVAGAATLIQNSQLMKCIPEISNDFFYIYYFQLQLFQLLQLQTAFTILGIGLFLNSGRISA